jgi:hypothetical protein
MKTIAIEEHFKIPAIIEATVMLSEATEDQFRFDHNRAHLAFFAGAYRLIIAPEDPLLDFAGNCA